jgi:putative DNA primase/helicase
MSATATSDALLTQRQALIRNGYLPIPLLGKGELGIPKGWPQAIIDERQVSEWHGHDTYSDYTNTGLRCDGIAAIDIDVPNEKLSFALAKEASERFGKTSLLRVGKSPKVLMVYRLAAPDCGRIATTKYEFPGCPKGIQVEILNGNGKQFVGFGVHPETGKPYHWVGVTPEDVKTCELRPVTVDGLRAFLAECDTIIRAAGGVPRKSAAGEAGGDKQPSAHGATAALADVQAALAVIPNSGAPDWNEWTRVGLAVWAATEGSDEGREAFGEWSAKNEACGAGETPDEAWERIAGCKPDRIGAGTLFHMARQVVPGWQPPSRGVRSDGSEFEAKPTIKLRRGDISGQVDQAEAALVASGRGIYHRGNTLVFLGETVIDTSNARKVSGVRIFPVGDHALVEHLTAAADWRGYDARAKQETIADAPMAIAKTLMQRQGQWKFIPPLRGIVHAPTLRPDGTLLDQPGYDAPTGLLLDPRGAEFPAIPDAPGRADAKRALGMLKTLIETFPFVGEEDRAVALSAILTACVRRSLLAAPMHGFTAPTAGTGKSKLVDIASVIATGREAGVIAQGSGEEEMQKRLGSMLLAGDAFVALDNCEAPVGGEFLCQLLTQPFVRTRVLGRSETPELPADCFVAATGNNLRIVGDAARRAVLCRVDANVERPELRVFDHDAVDIAKANRGDYAVAAVTILRAYQVAGSPKGAKPLGSFGAWSRWVRDALLWLGEADPVATMAFIREGDPELEDVRAIFAQWRDVIGTDRVAVREVIERAVERLGEYPAGFINADLREALLTVAGNRGAVDSRKLGEWLAARTSKIVDGYQIVQAGLSGGRQTWSLRKAA